MRTINLQWKDTPGMATIKVSQLVRDHTLYPRKGVDYSHVQQMVNAAEAGAEFPPIIVCRRTNRIVDGYHRVAMLEKFGIDEAACVFKSYRNDEEYFLDAVRYNSEHGLTLSAADRMHSIEIAEGMKISMADIGSALRMTVNAAGKLKAAPITSAADISVPAVSVSPRFAAADKSPIRGSGNEPDASGALAIIGPLDCVIHWLEDNTPDAGNQRVITRLHKLYSLLQSAVEPIAE